MKLAFLVLTILVVGLAICVDSYPFFRNSPYWRRHRHGTPRRMQVTTSNVWTGSPFRTHRNQETPSRHTTSYYNSPRFRFSLGDVIRPRWRPYEFAALRFPFTVEADRRPGKFYTSLYSHTPAVFQSTLLPRLRHHSRGLYKPGVYRQRTAVCPWRKLIDSTKLTMLLKRVLQEYNRSKNYTVKDITETSVRICKRCDHLGCTSRSELSLEFTLAPTDGCNWKDLCDCKALRKVVDAKCHASGTLLYNEDEIQNLIFTCNGVSVLKNNADANDPKSSTVVEEGTTTVKTSTQTEVTPTSPSPSEEHASGETEESGNGDTDFDVIRVPLSKLGKVQKKGLNGESDQDNEPIPSKASFILDDAIEEEELLKYK